MTRQQHSTIHLQKDLLRLRAESARSKTTIADRITAIECENWESLRDFVQSLEARNVQPNTPDELTAFRDQCISALTQESFDAHIELAKQLKIMQRLASLYASQNNRDPHLPRLGLNDMSGAHKLSERFGKESGAIVNGAKQQILTLDQTLYQGLATQKMAQVNSIEALEIENEFTNNGAGFILSMMAYTLPKLIEVRMAVLEKSQKSANVQIAALALHHFRIQTPVNPSDKNTAIEIARGAVAETEDFLRLAEEETRLLNNIIQQRNTPASIAARNRMH